MDDKIAIYLISFFCNLIISYDILYVILYLDNKMEVSQECKKARCG